MNNDISIDSDEFIDQLATLLKRGAGVFTFAKAKGYLSADQQKDYNALIVGAKIYFPYLNIDSLERAFLKLDYSEIEILCSTFAENGHPKLAGIFKILSGRKISTTNTNNN